MRTSYLFATVLGISSSLACSHEQETSPPASALSAPAANHVDDDSSNKIVRGNAPSSDPATDQSILARNTVVTGGAPTRDSGGGLAGSNAGFAGFGVAGVGGASPASRQP